MRCFFVIKFFEENIQNHDVNCSTALMLILYLSSRNYLSSFHGRVPMGICYKKWTVFVSLEKCHIFFIRKFDAKNWATPLTTLLLFWTLVFNKIYSCSWRYHCCISLFARVSLRSILKVVWNGLFPACKKINHVNKIRSAKMPKEVC